MSTNPDLIYGLNRFVTQPGSLGIGTVSNEGKVRFVISNAGMSNLIRVRARINNQLTWVTLTDITGSDNVLVDVLTYDQIEVIVLVYDSLSDRIAVVASSFDGSHITISTPDGEIINASALDFTSSDDSVIITADEQTGVIDFRSIGGGSVPYTAEFEIGDWTGPVDGLYSIEIEDSTHNKLNPLVGVYENDDQVFPLITLDADSNITISVSEAPDLRFSGKLTIS